MRWLDKLVAHTGAVLLRADLQYHFNRPSIEGLRGEQWEKVGYWTRGEKRGRVSGVLSTPLPLLAQEDP
eukprot:5201039-Pyramimonas_sp.AAC.1